MRICWTISLASAFLPLVVAACAPSAPQTPTAAPTAAPTPTEAAGIPAGKYLFVRYWVHVEGSGSLPALMIDFPTFFFDAATGELKLSPLPGSTIQLGGSQVGFFASGQSRSGAAGGGIASTLTPIDRVPFTTQVPRFADFVGTDKYENVPFAIQRVGADATMEAEIGGERVTLRAGEKWEQVIEKDVRAPRGPGRIKVTHTLTNHGWLDRAKILAPTPQPTKAP